MHYLLHRDYKYIKLFVQLLTKWIKLIWINPACHAYRNKDNNTFENMGPTLMTNYA